MHVFYSILIDSQVDMTVLQDSVMHIYKGQLYIYTKLRIVCTLLRHDSCQDMTVLRDSIMHTHETQSCIYTILHHVYILLRHDDCHDMTVLQDSIMCIYESQLFVYLRQSCRHDCLTRLNHVYIRNSILYIYETQTCIYTILHHVYILVRDDVRQDMTVLQDSITYINETQ